MSIIVYGFLKLILIAIAVKVALMMVRKVIEGFKKL
jgi:hypothetical protein